MTRSYFGDISEVLDGENSFSDRLYSLGMEYERRKRVRKLYFSDADNEQRSYANLFSNSE